MTTVINASTFKALIAEGHFERTERSVVSGEVSFRGGEISSSLRLLHVTFLGPVDFGDVEVAGSLDLTGCHFARTLCLAGARVEGSLILDDVVVEASGRGERAGNYDWEVVERVLNATSMNVAGGLSARYLTVVGDADFARCRVGGEFGVTGFEIRGSLNCTGIQVEGDLQFLAGFRSDAAVVSQVLGSIEAANLHVRGNLAFAGVHVAGDLNIWSAQIEGNCWIRPSYQVEDNKDFHPARTVVEGDLHMGASRVAGHVQLEGIQVDGKLQIFSCDLGPTTIGPTNEVQAGNLRFTGCSVGALAADNSVFRGHCNMAVLKVTGLGAGARRAVSFSNTEIRSHVRFWSPGQFHDGTDTFLAANMPAEKYGSIIVGDVDFSGARIGGELDLTAINVDGAVLLDDARIQGDVTFKSAVSLLNQPRLSESYREMQARLVAAASAGQLVEPKATLRRLSMVMLHCDNDVDLSGLELIARQDEIKAHTNYGSIDARDIEVAGHLWQFHRLDEARWRAMTSGEDAGPPPTADAIIPGSADYSGAKVWHVSLSGRSFQTPLGKGEAPQEVEKQRGIILAGAQINELQIQPLADLPCIFPIPINLAETKVSVWSIDEDDSNRFQRYQTLLASDQTFRRSTYLAVEASLRNRGHEADADRIYRSMVRRAAQESWRRPSNPLVRLFAWALRPFTYIFRLLFWDWMLGFGTAPWRVGLLILAAFSFSTFAVYLDDRNIGQTLTSKIAQGSTGSPQQWELTDAIAVGVRVHIPLVTWDLRDEWQLVDEPDAPLYLAGASVPWIRPEDWGMAMMIFNLLAWPPFLAFALRRAFRFANG